MGCYNSTVVDAQAERVWAATRKFHDLSWCPDVITELKVVGDKNAEEIGAQRLLNGAFAETLRSLDDENMELTYSIDDGPGAVSRENIQNYVGRVRVFPVTDEAKAFVLWSSSWDSGGEGAAELCNPIYQALLTSLKGHFA